MSKHNYQDVIQKAEGSDTTIYGIRLGVTGTFWVDNALRFLAQRTGGSAYFPDIHGEYSGLYHEPNKTLDEVVETVGAHLRHQYSIGFALRDSEKDGRPHKVRIEVARDDIDQDGKPDRLTVHHRQTYRAPKR